MMKGFRAFPFVLWLWLLVLVTVPWATASKKELDSTHGRIRGWQADDTTMADKPMVPFTDQMSEDLFSPVLMSRSSLVAESSLKKFQVTLPSHTRHFLRGGHDTDSPPVEHTPRQLGVTELTVMCVPWQGDPNKRHVAISGQPHRLKGVFKTPDTGMYYYKWVYGDGTESGVDDKSGLVKYIVEDDHTYTGSEGTPFNARLMVSQDSMDFTTSRSCEYKIHIQEDTLDSRANVAIDNGLWYLYKSGTSTSSYYHTFNGSPVMVWSFSSYYASPTASAVHAFEINGHKESGDPTVDPYVEAVEHGLNWLFHGYYGITSYPMLQPHTIGLQRTEDPDSNSNGIGIEVKDRLYRPVYEGGMVMDAIIASGTPDKDCGRDFDGDGHNDTYREVVQDMIDMYAWGQYDGTRNPYGIIGGWRYNWNTWPDNSAAQWAAIGIIPALEPPWNCNVPDWVKEYNNNWLNYSFYEFSNNIWGGFGYNFPTNGWGYAQTPYGMVQLAFVGAGTNDTRWEKTERWMADNWVMGSNWLNQGNMYAYYALAKAMRLAKPEPVTTFAIDNFDWYRGNGLVMGLADKVASQLITHHYWDYYGRNLATAWAVIILKPVLFSEAPIPCFDADPNPSYPDSPISFDPSCSDHAEEGKDIHSLVLFEWDFDDDGAFDHSEEDPVVVQHSFSCVSIPCIYPVTLQVTDDSEPARTATYVRNIEISNPPHPPVAIVLSPYMVSFCAGDTLVLDGSDSYEPNEGEHEDGCGDCPDDTITAWDWDLTGAPFNFLDEHGEFVDLGTNESWGTYFPNSDIYDIGLRVTDNTALACYPNSGKGDLNDEAFGSVEVYDDCLCGATGVPTCLAVELNWGDIGADMYYIYRSLTGPNLGFQDIGQTTETSKIAGSFVMGQPQWYRIMAESGDYRCTSGSLEVNGPPSLCNPTADPGGPYSYCKGETVPLDGSASTALAGTIVAWDWDFDNDGGYDDAFGEHVGHVWTENGRYTVGLKVTSSDSLTLTDNATVVVEIGLHERCNEAPEIVADIPAIAVDEGEEAQVTGTVTDADGDTVTLTASAGTITNHGDGNWTWQHLTTDGPSESQTVTITVDDGHGGTSETTFELVVNNVAPNITTVNGPTERVNIDEPFNLDSIFTDPGDDSDWICEFDWDDGAVETHATSLHECHSETHSYAVPGEYMISVKVTDKDGAFDTQTILVRCNAEPVVAAVVGTVTEDEGNEAQLTGKVTDADDDSITLTASAGTITNHDDGTWTWRHSTTDGPDESQTVAITGDDGHGGTSEMTFELIVNNVPPDISTIYGPADPVDINNQPINLDVDFTDPGEDSDWECEFDWGDGTTPDKKTTSVRNCPSDHSYSEPGIYEISVKVTDKDGGLDTQVFQHAVVYDPFGGFVTGGGWIESPKGALVGSDATGKANLGFNAKYKKGVHVPTGNANFQFKEGDFSFKSTAFKWLRVDGTKAQFIGSGAINGDGDYKFLVQLTDCGKKKGGKKKASKEKDDSFHIKVWEEDVSGNENIQYDNKVETVLGGGSIVVHKAK